VGAWHSARAGRPIRRHWLRAVALAAVVVAWLQIPSAERVTPVAQATLAASAGRAGNPADELARLEVRAARLSRQYRGQVVTLDEAGAAAKKTTAGVLRLRRQVRYAHQQVARIAAASFMGVAQDPTLVLLGGGDAQRMLEKAATLEYLGRQRSAREQALSRLMAADQRAEHAAQAKVAELSRLLTKLASQRQSVAALMARFKSQSPVTGDNITPRMSQVKDEVDRRFGPFISIGCFRPGSDGEHPLGRACDFMLSSGGVLPSASNVQLGYAIAAWAQANASRLGIMYIIYRQKIWDIRMASSAWVPMEDRGSITANHFDHVHISVF
jgi:hypothetical protein